MVSRKTCSQKCASTLSGLARRGIPKSDEAKKKASETCKRHYAKKTGFVATCLERYGKENPFAVEEVQNKIQTRCLVEYGVPYWTQSLESRKHTIRSNQKRETSASTREKHRLHALQQMEGGLKSRGNEGYRDDIPGVFFRSSWEANFARVLNYLGLAWEFEPVVFSLDQDVYIPDFKVKSVFYEIKGWFDETSKRKISKFLSAHPSENLVVIGPESYRNLKKSFCSKVQHWE